MNTRISLALAFYSISLYHHTIFAQSPNFSEDVAIILYNNCTQCHHTGGVAPFPLENYQDAFTYKNLISTAVNQRTMPPWPPDTSYSRFTHERTLTQDEINTITIWVNTGAPQGDSTLAPCPPDFVENTFLGTPDLQLTIPTYTSKATISADDYVCFSLPTNLTTDRYVEAVEIVPGNPEIVHHVIMYVDASGNYPTDTIGGNCMGPNSSANVLGAYAPGGLPTIFPNGNGVKMGVKIPAGANVVLAMHYPEGSAGQKDSTSVKLFFYPTNVTGVREVAVAPVGYDFSFCIPPNQTITISDNNPIPANISVLSIFPHMHLLGASLRSFAVTPANDTIKLIDIPHWDFEWQDFYTFKNIIKIPAGSMVYSSGTYDNTTNNHHNPNNPPQQVCAGLNTTDEMFIVSLQFTTYQNGDELISLEHLLAPPQPVAIAVGSSNICNGNPVTLSANSGFASYRWCPGGETSQSIQVISPGPYYVEVKDSKGIRGYSNTIMVTEGSASPPVVADQIICRGESATLSASGGTSYLWNTGSGNASITVSPQNTAVYSVTATDAGGCTASTLATVTVNDNPTVTLTNETICQGESAMLDAGTGYTYNWSTGALTQTIQASIPGAYSVTVNDNNGCTATGIATISVNPLPSISITGNQAICQGNSTQLIASGGMTYSWSTGNNSSMINVNPVSTSNYSVTVTDVNNCVASTNTTVTVYPNPTVNLQDATICQGSITTLDARNTGASYNWSTGATTQTIAVNNTGTYSVTVTNSNNCTGTGQATITIGTGLTVNISDVAICQGDTVALDAGHPGASYAWSTGAMSQAIQVSAQGIYLVTVTDPNNCTGSGSASVVVNPLPNAYAGADTQICEGSSIILTASGGTGYSWSNGTGNAINNVTPSQTSTYTVTVTDGNNCSSTDDILVDVITLPQVNLMDKEICQGDTVLLDAGNPGMQFNWSNGATGQSISVDVSGTYTVSVSHNGCESIATSQVTVYDLPQVNNTTDTICQGASTTLSAPGNFNSYLWNTGSTNQSITVSPSVTTDYIVEVTNNEGCSNSAIMKVIVKPCTSIDNPDKPLLLLYPNPAADITYLSLTNQGGKDFLFSVRDMLGKEALRKSITQQASPVAIDLSAYEKGIYFVEVISDEFRVVRKLIVY